jgi:hypothetical protein
MHRRSSEEKYMGEAIGNGFTALAVELAKASGGVALMGVTSLGLALQFSIFDHNVISWMKNAVLRLVGGALITASAAGLSLFITQNFK